LIFRLILITLVGLFIPTLISFIANIIFSDEFDIKNLFMIFILSVILYFLPFFIYTSVYYYLCIRLNLFNNNLRNVVKKSIITIIMILIPYLSLMFFNIFFRNMPVTIGSILDWSDQYYYFFMFGIIIFISEIFNKYIKWLNT